MTHLDDFTQQDLLDLLCHTPDAARRFREFHDANPHVYRILVDLAREWVRRTGRHRVGIRALMERARWELSIQTTDEAPVLNNSWSPYYARLIMRQEPDLDGLFELRRAAADRGIGVAA